MLGIYQMVPSLPSGASATADVDLRVDVDDIDRFGSAHPPSEPSELVPEPLRTSVHGRVVRERMTTQGAQAITPRSLVNIPPR